MDLELSKYTSTLRAYAGSTMSGQYSHAIPPTVKVLFLEDLSDLGGPLFDGEAEQVSLHKNRGVGTLMFSERKLS